MPGLPQSRRSRAEGCPDIKLDPQSLKVVKKFCVGDTMRARGIKLTKI